ncbi:hypothetical protein O3744_07355 [Prevotella jejuni]|jgi:putative ATP-binding protein|nr:hypothetical protein [Prevotella jejuni]
MSISKDVIKQCLISKQREVDEAVLVERPIDFEENGNYVIVGVRHAGKSYLLYQRVRQLQVAGKGMGVITEVTPPSLLVLRMYPYPDTSMAIHQHLTINTQQ